MKTKKICLGSGCISLRHGKKLLSYLPIVGMVLAATSAKAADSPGVKFNTSVRYSQWAIDSRTHDFMLNASQFGLATYDANGNKLVARTDSKNKLDYVGGLVSKAVIEAADYYEGYDWSKPWFYSVKEYADNYASKITTAGESFDDLNGAKLYIGIFNNSNATDADKKTVATALSRVKTGLKAANSNYVIASGTVAEKAGKEVAGGWWHKKSYPNTMWCDGAYMGSALLGQLAAHYGTADNVFGSKTADWDMTFKQLNIVWNMCWNATDKLLYHGFDANAAQGWAGLSATEPYVFHSAAYWGRANAWYLMALVDVLEAMGKDGQSTTANYTTLKEHLTELAAGIAARQDKTTGGWYQLMNHDNTFTSTKKNANYIETSATSLFSAALFKAVRLGLLDNSYKEVAQNAFMGLVDNFVSYNNGKIQIWGSSRSAGLDSSRPGSEDYYLDGDDVVMVKQGETTEGKVLGGFIMAATEYERAYLGQDSKRVLFAYDLAPEYDFSTTAGSIKAEAYGKGTVTYEWFKSADGSSNGTGVSGATSDTFAPTEDGYYFCSAKDENGATAQTRTTYVKANKSATGGDDTPTTSTTIFSYTVPTSGSASTDDVAVTGGKVAYQKSGSFSSDGYKIDSDTKYIKLTLDNTLKEGDVIEIAISSQSDGKGGIIASTTTSTSNGLPLGSIPSGGKSTTIKYAVTSSDILNGQNTVYLFRQAVSTYVSSITITRAGSSEPTTTLYTVSALSTEGGSVTITSGDTKIESGSKVNKGTALTFTARTDAEISDYDFTGWTVNGKSVDGTNPVYTVESLDGDITVEATFKRMRANVWFPAGNGTTTATLDSKELTHGQKVNLGSKVTFTATANSGYKFSNWKILGEKETPISENVTDNPYTITIDHDYNVQAQYVKESETPVTPVSANSTFGLDDLKTLASNASATEKSSLTDDKGYITIEAGDNIKSGNSSGLKLSDDTYSFYIKAKNGAKIKTVELITNSSKNSLIFDPAVTPTYTKSDSKNVWTYDCSSILPTTITVKGTSSSVAVSNIKVTYEATTVVEKKDFIATFTPATIDATEDDASVDLPTLKITAGDDEIAADNYTIGEYTSTDENVAKVADGKVEFVGKGNADIKVTVTPKDATLYNGCEASFKVNVAEKTTPVDPTRPDVVYDFTTTVGATASYSKGVYADGTTRLVFGSDFKAAEGKYITITAKDNGGFKVGDKITLKGYCNSTYKSGIEIRSVAADASIFKTNTLAKHTAGDSEYTYTLTEGCDSLCFGRFGGGNVYLTSLQVVRPASSAEKTRLTASFAKNSDIVVNTTTTVDLPKLTVMAGDKELTTKQYTVDYKSNAEDVAVVEDEKINIKGEGTATIIATVAPVDADNYVGCTATYQLTVKQPSLLNISVQDVLMNVTDVEVKQPVINVYGDDDKLLTLGEDYTLSYSVDGDKNVSVDNDGVFSVSGKSYAWTEGVSAITVTATPTESLGENYAASSFTFNYSVTKGKRTPVFMQSFSGTTIKLHCDKDNRQFTVPLYYNGEDVSDYFAYTYTVDNTAGIIGGKTKHTLKYAPTTEGKHTVTVSAEPTKVGDDDYTDVYNTPVSISFTLDVNADYKIPTITLEPDVVEMVTGNSEGAPDLTVTVKGADGKTDEVLADNAYTTTWTSFNPYYARIDATTGRIEAVSEGDVEGRVLVQGDNIESKTAFFTIKIDDPAKYRVKTNGKEKYGNRHVMWNQNKTLSVTLGGWQFPKEGSANTYKPGEKLSSAAAWADYSNQAKWTFNGYDNWVAPTMNQKNARQENGSNARPESTEVSTADFKTKGTIKDQMFNVPCSGSYLEFNPVTNGTVTVNIFQNGAFDKTGTDYQYRPQRRVFVMDEAGNVVNTKGVIGNANGKPTGKEFNLTKYNWDITNETPTIGLVNSHFNGLDDFNFTEDGFKNNLYTSSLSTDIVPNEAVANHPDWDGAKGWCVLADSPVEYTFPVKAGKTYFLYNYGSKISFYGFSFKEDAQKPVVDNIEYDEAAADNNVTATAEGHVAIVKVKRVFEPGRWAACVLPFNLNKAQVDAIFGETYSSDKRDGGTQIMYFDRIEGNKAYFVRHAYNNIVAGKPFIIKPAKKVECINTADCAEYPYVQIENTKPADWCEGNGYAWVSSYNADDMTLKAGDCFISGSTGDFMNYTGADAPIKGFRGYLKANLSDGAKPKTLMAATGSLVDGDSSTTFIDGLQLNSDGSISAGGIEDGKVYNVNGQQVGDNMNSLNALPSGVYVINGKKYVK